MIVPLPQEQFDPFLTAIQNAIVVRFGDFGLECWQGFASIYFTGWWAERECNYAIIAIYNVHSFRRLFDEFVKFDQGIAEHKGRLARRMIAADPPLTLPEIISQVYGFDWKLGFAVETNAADLDIPQRWEDFGFSVPALLIDEDGTARWLDNDDHATAQPEQK